MQEMTYGAWEGVKMAVACADPTWGITMQKKREGKPQLGVNSCMPGVLAWERMGFRSWVLYCRGVKWVSFGPALCHENGWSWASSLGQTKGYNIILKK